MTTRVLRTQGDIEGLQRFLHARKLPVTVTIMAGAKRTNLQNALLQKWNQEITDQRGDTDFEEVRAENKIMFGVPILRRDDPEYREWYDATIKPLPWEAKVTLFRRMDPPVTRGMTTKQLSEYCDTLQRHYLQQGFQLVDPEAMRYA